MDARYYITFNDFLREGDQAAVYVHGGKFVAIIKFVGKYFYSEEDIGWTKGDQSFLFPYRMNFTIIKEGVVPLKISYSTIENGNKAEHVNLNLIDNLTFIANKGRTWNQYM